MVISPRKMNLRLRHPADATRPSLSFDIRLELGRPMEIWKNRATVVFCSAIRRTILRIPHYQSLPIDEQRQTIHGPWSMSRMACVTLLRGSCNVFRRPQPRREDCRFRWCSVELWLMQWQNWTTPLDRYDIDVEWYRCKEEIYTEQSRPYLHQIWSWRVVKHFLGQTSWSSEEFTGAASHRGLKLTPCSPSSVSSDIQYAS